MVRILIVNVKNFIMLICDFVKVNLTVHIIECIFVLLRLCRKQIMILLELFQDFESI